MNFSFSMQQTTARMILFGMILSLMPFGVAYAGPNASISITVGAPQHQEDEQPELLPLALLAHRVLQDASSRTIPGLENVNSILDAHAQEELQLDWLLKALDRTQTYLGKNGLMQSMNPTNDLDEIQARQQLIATFLDDAHIFNSVTQSLQQVAKSEEAVLTYWNPKDPVTWGVKHFYFNLGPFKKFNNSKVALEAITLFDAGSTFKTLAAILFMQGLFNEISNFAQGIDVDVDRIKDGFFKHFYNHNPFTCRYMNSPNSGFSNEEIYVPNCTNKEHREKGAQVALSGTLKDSVLYLHHVSKRQGNTLSSFAQAVKSKLGFSSSSQAQPADNGNDDSFPIFSWATMLAATAFSDYALYTIFTQSKDKLKSTHHNLEALRNRMIDVADFIKAIQALERLIAASPELQAALPAHVKNNIAISQSLSPKMNELVALLNTATFKKSKSIFYLRGKVLYANLLFRAIKHELVPAMQAVAEIDAYCSLARLMKEMANSANKFSFVTFTDSAHAYLDLDNCWISVLDSQESVANSMVLGHLHPGKVIITGPNGGGKSTWLKAAGQAVAMAQAWGIAPADKASMSVFDAIRTSLDPHENLSHGLSKFMAQKESMDKIQQFILDERHKISLILLDEPYDGTVTDEIARRTSEFCDNVANEHNCLTIIATHIMPTLKNRKSYGLYHVDIKELQPGVFERTFKLKRGVAKRWFSNAAWRTRFIDWLSIETRNKMRANKAQ